MPDYPSTLPRPDEGSYAGVIDQGLIRTSFRVTSPSQVKGYNSPREDIVMTFSMENGTYNEWQSWVNANAYDWFNMEIVSSRSPADITSNQLVRFTSDVQVLKRGDNWLSATVSLELVPSA